MPASYMISVRQVSDLLSASFRFYLTIDTLAVQLMIPLTRLIWDFHTIVLTPCAGRTSSRRKVYTFRPLTPPYVRFTYTAVLKFIIIISDNILTYVLRGWLFFIRYGFYHTNSLTLTFRVILLLLVLSISSLFSMISFPYE